MDGRRHAAPHPSGSSLDLELELPEDILWTTIYELSLHQHHPATTSTPGSFADSPSFPALSPASSFQSDSYLLQSQYYNAAQPSYRAIAPRSMSVSASSASEQFTTRPNLPPPRQIRFVSTDGQPHAKRRRINAACLTCRKRKTRCSGERPQCKTCLDTAHSCAGYADRTSRKSGDDRNDDDSDEAESGYSSPIRNNVLAQRSQPPASHIDNRPPPYLRGSREDDVRSPESTHTVSSTSANRHRWAFKSTGRWRILG
jgi:hypothetical protein